MACFDVLLCSLSHCHRAQLLRPSLFTLTRNDQDLKSAKDTSKNFHVQTNRVPNFLGYNIFMCHRIHVPNKLSTLLIVLHFDCVSTVPCFFALLHASSPDPRTAHIRDDYEPPRLLHFSGRASSQAPPTCFPPCLTFPFVLHLPPYRLPPASSSSTPCPPPSTARTTRAFLCIGTQPVFSNALDLPRFFLHRQHPHSDSCDTQTLVDEPSLDSADPHSRCARSPQAQGPADCSLRCCLRDYSTRLYRARRPHPHITHCFSVLHPAAQLPPTLDPSPPPQASP